jgi:hypothetical protein
MRFPLTRVRRGGDVAWKAVKNPGNQLIDKVRSETFPGCKGYARNVMLLEVSRGALFFNQDKTWRSDQVAGTKVVIDNW